MPCICVYIYRWYGNNIESILCWNWYYKNNYIASILHGNKYIEWICISCRWVLCDNCTHILNCRCYLDLLQKSELNYQFDRSCLCENFSIFCCKHKRLFNLRKQQLSDRIGSNIIDSIYCTLCFLSWWNCRGLISYDPVYIGYQMILGNYDNQYVIWLASIVQKSFVYQWGELHRYKVFNLKTIM